MICPNCGSQVPDGYAFCGNCGCSMKQAQPAPQPAPVQNPTPTYTPPQEYQYNPPITTQEKPKSKALPIVLAAIGGGIALLVAVVFLVFPLMGLNLFEGKSKTPATKEPNKPTTAVVEDSHLPKDNLYSECFETYPDYVLPESDSRYYSHRELMNMPLTHLTVAQQELYARHGVAPTDSDLQAYFNARAWFTPSSETVTLNTYEEINLALLNVCIAQAQGTFTTSSNPYLVHLPYSDTILTYSSTQYLNANDLYHLTSTELLLIRNEIFARHGYIFEDPQLLDYFLCQDWYEPSILADDFSESSLNEYEAGNVGLIQVYERKANGVHFSPGNPYSYYSYYDYVFGYSDSYPVESYDVQGMSIDELCLARNEILARHGYTFTDEHLLEYFLQKSWYRPTTPPGRSDLISLTSIETQNIEMIRSYEDYLKTRGY